jgi:hypothetical protein
LAIAAAAPAATRNPLARQTDPDRRPTKAERKEQARLERIELERRLARRKQASRRALLVGVAVAAVTGIIIFALSRGGSPEATGSGTPSVTVALPNPDTLPGMLTTSPPWPNNVAEAGERLRILQLPGLSDTVLHHHANLLIYIDGQQVTIPANIGLDSTGSPPVASPLHTHSDLGTIHVESADPNFEPVLGQFMDVWGVYFTKDRLGGNSAVGDTKVRAYVNGEEWTGDPTQIPLNDHDVIILTFGTPDQVPADLTPTFNVDGTPA